MPEPDAILAECRQLLAAGAAEEAAARLLQAHRRHPGCPAILILAGDALTRLGQVEGAVGAVMTALALQPGHAETHLRLADALVRAGRVDRAVAHGREAFRLAPEPRFAVMLSALLAQTGQYGEALDYADRVLAEEPDHAMALVGRALALDFLGRAVEAIATGWRALRAAPGHAMAQYHQAERLLRQGQFTPEAWALYDARLRLNGHTDASGLPVWKGEDVRNRTVLLLAEQGLGDTLQFVRYAPSMAARGARVVLAVQPPLVRLLQGTPGVDEVVPVGGTLPAFDVVCPLLSLPGRFGATLAQLPPPLPYAGRFSHRPAPAGVLRVGLVWAGRPGFVHDAQRSIPPSALAVLAGVPGVQFYNLQHGEGAAAALPSALGAVDLMAGVADFADTAALVAGLDLVVAVDTAVAHLAATMGKPVWLLSRVHGCWRWLHGRTDSPWYPSVRILRQFRPGDWADVLEEVRQDLRALARQAQLAAA